MDQNSGVTAETKKAESSAERPTTSKIPAPKTAKDKKKYKKQVGPSSKAKSKRGSKKKEVVETEDESSDSESSSEASTDSDDSSDSGSDSSSSVALSKKKSKVKKLKAQAKALVKELEKQKKRSKKKITTEDEDSYSEDDSEEEIIRPRSRVRVKPSKRVSRKHDSPDRGECDVIEIREDPKSARLRQLKSSLRKLDFDNNPLAPPSAVFGMPRAQLNPEPIPLSSYDKPRRNRRREAVLEDEILLEDLEEVKPKKQKKPKRASKVAYKRVDQLWDQSIHNFKLTETVKNTGEAIWDQYIFTVRRRFDWEHKYLATVVDIKSEPLKQCLQHVMAGVKGISLVEDTPHLDPNMLFLYLEEMRDYIRTLEDEAGGKKRKEAKVSKTKAKHLRVMVKYLDKDFAETKKNLYPMLDNGMITFDLLWALYKPNAIVYTSTYGDQEEPRAFKIDFTTKESHFMRGSWYIVEGRYLEYDGKNFGMGTTHAEISSFQGVRKITSLDCYPLQYHKHAEKMRTQLIDRGKHFVALQGMNYRHHRGMAYTKRKKQVLKINIDGRVMVDPAIHRRINPNYPASVIKPKDDPDGGMLDDTDESYGFDSGSDMEANNQTTPSDETIQVQETKRYKVVRTPNGENVIVEVNSKEDIDWSQNTEPLGDDKLSTHEFTEEELLIASPVVLGFAFGEKLWLEFTVSGISDVVFNDQAFESLVLPDNHKSIVKALVSSHTFQAHKSIDDIISGKGRGLVAVLHGPPGTGKTLTAEGIADLLKCPLYMVSAGDLGTEPTKLEKELQNILDIAHSWGAILLLDEADVFLEQRSIHDIHRNALVSIFLRLLEYFQGILFLTTNRVETFDAAFVSRIHLSLRFQNLTTKAKRTVWKLFIDRVKNQEGMQVANITEQDYNDLARREVNGRQIKNLVRAAQALAVHEEVPLSMVHIRRVIDVAESFEMDLKGGTGYTDAMRSEFCPPNC
ncbi:putative AAA family ATPase [Fonsecaea pedrosoi]|nr:putative AAA family ATPase [Fonsecaea pedrosoi]